MAYFIITTGLLHKMHMMNNLASA